MHELEMKLGEWLLLTWFLIIWSYESIHVFLTFLFFPFCSSAAFDAFGDVLQPQQAAIKPMNANQAPTLTPMPAAGGMMINSNGSNANASNSSSSQQGSGSGSLIKGDLDSSLASLVQNLDINISKGGFKSQQMRSQQFASPKNSVRTGGPNATVSWPSPSPTPTVFPPQNNMPGAHLSWNQPAKKW